MDEINEIIKNAEIQSLQVWCCGDCEAVHLKAGKVLLNLIKSEFAELAHGGNDVYQNEFGSLEFYNLMSSLKAPEEVLTSDSSSSVN